MPAAALVAIGLVLLLLPGALLRDVAAGAVLLTAAALALQAAVSLMAWRLMTIRGERAAGCEAPSTGGCW